MINPNVTTVYFIGIKGVGMSTLSIVLKEKGLKVVGSDLDERFVTDEVLERANIKILKGFTKQNIVNTLGKLDPETALVIVTGAHNGLKNPEAVEADKLGIDVVVHGEALGMIMQEKKQISVSGTHGKTTTSAMTTHILVKDKKDPAYLVGSGNIASLKSPGHWGNGEYFVSEADEYITDLLTEKKPRFHYQEPDICVVTSVDYDHPDVFDSLEEVISAFEVFIHKTKKNGVIIINNDDKNCNQLKHAAKSKALTYGVSDDSTVQIRKISIKANKTEFDIPIKGKKVCSISLLIPGFFNIQNATAAAIAANQAGVSWENISKHLRSFKGTKRRFELVNNEFGISLYDDYAHHPREIRATLDAVTEWFPNSHIGVIFQPHTYSRTKALFDDFAISFSKADYIGITDIFASAREKKDVSVSSEMLAFELKKQNPNSYYVKNSNEINENILTKMKSGDILITMGAGDIYTWHPDIVKAIKQLKIKKV